MRLRELSSQDVDHTCLWKLNLRRGPILHADEFVDAVRIRLGCAGPVVPTMCAARNAGWTGATHASCCALSEATRGHNAVAQVVQEAAPSCDPTAETEVPGLIQAQSSAWLITSALRNALAALNVSICFPHAQEAGFDCSLRPPEHPPCPEHRLCPFFWNPYGRPLRHVDRFALSASASRAGVTWPRSRQSTSASTHGSLLRSGGARQGRQRMQSSSPLKSSMISAALLGRRLSSFAVPSTLAAHRFLPLVARPCWHLSPLLSRWLGPLCGNPSAFALPTFARVASPLGASVSSALLCLSASPLSASAAFCLWPPRSRAAHFRHSRCSSALSPCSSGGGGGFCAARRSCHARVWCLARGLVGIGFPSPAPSSRSSSVARSRSRSPAPLPSGAPRRICQPRGSVALDSGIGAVCDLAAKSSPTALTPHTRLKASSEASQSAIWAHRLRSYAVLVVEVALLLPSTFQTPPSLRAPRRPRLHPVSLPAREAFVPLRPLPSAFAALPCSHASCEGPCSACQRCGALGLGPRSAPH